MGKLDGRVEKWQAKSPIMVVLQYVLLLKKADVYSFGLLALYEGAKS